MEICSISCKNHVDVPSRNVKIDILTYCYVTYHQLFPGFIWTVAGVFSGWSVSSHMAVQHLAKPCKNHKLCCLPGAECRWKLLCSGSGTWHTPKLCYFFVNFHRRGEQKPSLRKLHSTVTPVCNTQRDWAQDCSTGGAGKEQEPPGDGTSQGTASPATPLQPHLPSAIKGCFAAAQPH